MDLLTNTTRERIMRAYEMDRYLRDKGLTFEREGGKHRIYRYGKRTVAVPRGKSFKHTTVTIIDKFLRQIGGQETIPADSVSLPALVTDLVVPETVCETPCYGENQTRLPPGLFEVFKDFVHFCEMNADKAGEYEIRDILIQNGHQLPDWNSLLFTARQNEDISVLFDLNDALEMMKLKSFQLEAMLTELEKRTAPIKGEARMQEQADDTKAARIVTHGERNRFQPAAEAPRQSPVIAPAQRSFQSEPRPPIPQAYQTSLSPRQQAYLEILQVLGRLDLSEQRMVMDRVSGFVEMG